MGINNIQKITTDQFLNNNVKSFAKYVIQTRALPSIYDGLRIGARKITYAAITGTLKNGKKSKLSALLGDTLKLQYHHGDAALKNTAEQLGMQHNFPLAPLDIIGQIPSLRYNEVNTAARYLDVKINQNIDLFKTDSDLWKLTIDDGHQNEPESFYPLIPMILLWNTNSPGFGFSFRTFSHNINDVINACIRSIVLGTSNDEMLTHTDIIRPEIKGINPKNFIYNGNKNCWYNVGEYEIRENVDEVIIKELPYNITHEKYLKHLDSLRERLYIIDYKDYTKDSVFNIVIKFGTKQLIKKLQDKWNFYKNLKLFTKVPNLILNCLDENGNILFHETKYDLIDNFVKKRLNIYDKRKTLLVDELTNKIKDLENIRKFIELVVNDKLVIFKRTKSDIDVDFNKYGLTDITKCLRIPASKFTLDEINSLDNEIKETKEYLDYINNTSIQDMYIKELIELQKKLNDNKNE